MNGHTFAIELAARLLANGLLKPKALLSKLEKEKAALEAENEIGTTKDGRNRIATYWYVCHKNRPAMKDELQKTGYPQE